MHSYPDPCSSFIAVRVCQVDLRCSREIIFEHVKQQQRREGDVVLCCLRQGR